MAATRLYFTAFVEEQWRALAGPWLREQAGAAWKNPKPTVVLTPSRAESFYLRSRLVEEGVSFLGLRFWTPSDARKFLLGEMLPEIETATQAELRLVARACAEKLTRQAEADNATLTSTARDGRRHHHAVIEVRVDFEGREMSRAGETLDEEIIALVPDATSKTSHELHRALEAV